ncbi:MAG: hypothetical protein JXA14_01145 [Anaerolineae bacterium]|nr:hypothetical protein [Anaerolineae bacterium]
MLRKLVIPICIALMLLTACAPAAPPPTPAFTYIPTFTPIPDVTLAPTPTITPIPPLELTIHWPAMVSALRPTPIEVELVPPPGIAASANIRATVLAPDFSTYQSFVLVPREGNLYVSEDQLRLPLEPAPGDWWLVIDVESELEVEGRKFRSFQPAPVSYRDLAGLPSVADLHVPQDFAEVQVQGDLTAGGRVWRYEGGEVALWWAPGPHKFLSLDTAVVMLEATYEADAPTVTATEETEFQGQTAFRFHETWPGPEGGPAEALVVQGPDYWLYVLRVRALGGSDIPKLIHKVGETFAFVEE